VTDVRRAAEIAHRRGALLVTVTEEPFALAVLESPGELGADIAVGEGQPLGVPLQFGGPYVGLFACREGRDFLQQIPGRLVGETVDKNGERGYVLTLSTREQHIRRERATSNICTNTGLCALSVTIRMCMLGKQGFIEAGRQCLAKSEYLKAKIKALAGYSLVYPSTPMVHEVRRTRVRGGSAAASSTPSSPRVPRGFRPRTRRPRASRSAAHRGHRARAPHRSRRLRPRSTPPFYECEYQPPWRFSFRWAGLEFRRRRKCGTGRGQTCRSPGFSARGQPCARRRPGRQIAEEAESVPGSQVGTYRAF
jgi:hypothetical protein